MKKVILVGAHGKILRMVGQKLSASYEVHGIIRKEDHAEDLRNDGVHPVMIDIEKATEEIFTAAFSGFDAVIFGAGAGGNGVTRTYRIDQDAAIYSARAALAAQVSRFILISTIGSGRPEVWPEGGDYMKAKGVADAEIRAMSKLPWTIVRPSSLSNEPAQGKILIGESPDTYMGPTIPRADVASILVELVPREELNNTIFTVFGGSTPITQALDSLAAQ